VIQKEFFQLLDKFVIQILTEWRSEVLIRKRKVPHKVLNGKSKSRRRQKREKLSSLTLAGKVTNLLFN